MISNPHKTEVLPWFPPGEPTRSREVLVLGAGIAGASVARSLAERGWTVTVLERHVQPAQEASGNPAGIVLPVLSRTGNVLSRLTMLGMAYARQRMEALMPDYPAIAWQPTGVLRLARNPRHSAQQQKIAAQLQLPAEVARWVEAEEGSALVGVTVEQPGWWFAGGGALCPPALVHALLDHPQTELRTGVDVTHMRHVGDAWHLADATGASVACCENVILANAHDALALLPQTQAESLPLVSIRGQISLAAVPDKVSDQLADAQNAWTSLHAVACREGYVIPARDGQVCFGASFAHQAEGCEPSEVEHQGNVQRLQAIFPQATPPAVSALAGRVSYRCATPDRLPMLGPLHDAVAFRATFAKLHLGWPARRFATAEVLPGLWINAGHGARGLVWVGLLGEALACMMSGEASPLPQDLIHALHPARFEYRLMRTAPAHRKAWSKNRVVTDED